MYLDCSISETDYAPGLLLGTAGIAYALWQAELREKAEDAMRVCYRSPLLFDEANMFFGVAGWGMVSLFLYQHTGSESYIDAVARAVEWLLKTATQTPGGLCWPFRGTSRIHYGYGYGAAGIALFLLYAGRELNRTDVIGAACRALDYDLAHRVESQFGWGWLEYEGGFRQMPYWGQGAAGVGMVAIRAHRELGIDHYLSAAETIADSVSVRWTVLPSQLNGLSGIGDFLIDMFRITGRNCFRERALNIVEGLSLFALQRPEGTAFPGRWSTRISNDFGTGAAGVGFFLDRISDPSPKFLVDLWEFKKS